MEFAESRARTRKNDRVENHGKPWNSKLKSFKRRHKRGKSWTSDSLNFVFLVQNFARELAKLMAEATDPSAGFKTPRKSILRRPDSQETVGSVGSGRRVSFSPSNPLESLEHLIANEGLEAALKKLKELHAQRHAVRCGPLASASGKPPLSRKNATSFALLGSPAASSVKEEPESEGEDGEDEMWSDLEAFLNREESIDTPGWEADLQAFRKDSDAELRAPKQQPARELADVKVKDSKPQAHVVKRVIVPKNCDVKIVQTKVNIFDPRTWHRTGRAAKKPEELTCGSFPCDQATKSSCLGRAEAPWSFLPFDACAGRRGQEEQEHCGGPKRGCRPRCRSETT